MLRITLTNGVMINISGSKSAICNGEIEIEGAKHIEVIDDEPVQHKHKILVQLPVRIELKEMSDGHNIVEKDYNKWLDIDNLPS